MYKKIFVLAEGQTETKFVKEILCPYFFEKGKLLFPCTIVTSTDRRNGKIHKGGISNYGKIKSNLQPLLKKVQKSSDVCVTTMIDFYGLPTDTPGFNSSVLINEPYKKIENIEKEIYKDVEKIYSSESLGERLFIPYIQLHEFEALLFSDVEKIKAEYNIENYDFSELYDCVAKIKNPEFINNGAETAPSKRIIKCASSYENNKPTVGVSIAKAIGLVTLRQKCRHFREWIEKLENL